MRAHIATTRSSFGSDDPRSGVRKSPKPQVVAPITTRRPRTSLIDAEWEWLAERADRESFADSHTPSARITSPGLAPSTLPAPSGEHHVVAPVATTRFGARLYLLFVATALVSFALGMVALPLGAAVVSRLQRAPRADAVAAHLQREPPRRPAVVPMLEPSPKRETAEPPAAQLDDAVAFESATKANAPASLAAASKRPVTRPARRHAFAGIAPRPRVRTDNPY
jgi:hypothetical protein